MADRLGGDLEAVARNHLGERSDRGKWFRYEVDPRTDSPVLWFDYELTLPSVGGDIVPAVKLEFGSLTDQRPVGRQRSSRCSPLPLPDMEGERDEVVAMEVERTFWEKATILHAEYHRPADQPFGERFSRHYSDLAALWKQPAVERLWPDWTSLNVLPSSSRAFSVPPGRTMPMRNPEV